MTTGEFRELPDLPHGRYGHGCAVVTDKAGNKFLVVAGCLLYTSDAADE